MHIVSNSLLVQLHIRNKRESEEKRKFKGEKVVKYESLGKNEKKKKNR